MDGPETNQPGTGAYAADQQDWMDAGASAQPPAERPGERAEAAIAKMQGAVPPDMQPPDMGAPKVNAQPVPLVLRPARGGMLGVVDKIADVLTGSTRPEIYKDEDGNAFVYHPNLTRGQQWTRIGAELAQGAAAGLKAGRGGNIGGAAAAGVETGVGIREKQHERENEMTAQARQQTLDSANQQILRMQMAEQAWRFTRNQTKATQEDVDWNNRQTEHLVNDLGGKIIGTAEHPGDIAAMLKVNPTTAEDLIKRHIIEIRPSFGADGKPAGIVAVKMPLNYRDEMLPPGTTFHTFDPNNPAKLLEHHASDGMTVGEQSDLDIAAVTQQMKFQNEQTEQQQKKAQTGNIQSETDARNQELPGKIKETASQTAKNYGEANQANANAEAARAGNGPGNPSNLVRGTGNAAADSELSKWPAPVQASVLGLLSYDVDPSGFPQKKYAKGNEMARETATGIAKMIDPSWSEEEYGNRKNFLKEWKDPQKAGGTNISLNQAIQHLGELNKGIDALQNSHFWVWNKLDNLRKRAVDDPAVSGYKTPKQAVSNEMATVFKKTSGTDQEIKAWDNTADMADGPDNQRKSVREMLKLMVGRVDAVHQQYRVSMGRDTDQPIIGPEAAAVLESLGPEGHALVERDRAQTRGGQQQTQNLRNAMQQQAAPPQGTVGTMQFTDGQTYYVDKDKKPLGAVPK